MDYAAFFKRLETSVAESGDSAPSASAGAEELKRIETAQKFLEGYQIPLRNVNQLRKAEVLADRERRGLPMEVWVVPNRLAAEGVAPGKVMVYLLVNERADSEEWIRKISERLPSVGKQGEQLEFQVRTLPEDGRLEGGVPAVIIKQLGAPLGYLSGKPVIVVNDLRQALSAISPQWVYSIAVNDNLRGKEILLIDSIPLKDEIALYL